MTMHVAQELREAIKIAEDNNCGLAFGLCMRALAEIERLEAIETAARQMMEWQKQADPYDLSALLLAGDRLRSALGMAPAHR